MKNRILNYVYITAVIIVLLLPLLLIKQYGREKSSENRDLTAFPKLFSDNRVNKDYLSDFGAWFEDNFAFRQELVSMNGKLISNFFGTSPVDKIIVGKDNWLYSSSTINDYTGENSFSKRKVFNIARNLSIIQSQMQSHGKQFWFTVPANKNTLYDKNMPYYIKKSKSESNLQRVTKELKKQKVNYINLQDLFSRQDEDLYLKRDSHWNNDGALLAYNEIMNKLDLPHNNYSSSQKTVRTDYVGDLAKMIYPKLAEKEENQYYDTIMPFEYIGEGKKTDDANITTFGSYGTGSLLMYRDSFANTLIPFMAGEFGVSHFSKYVPYALESDIEQYDPDVVLIELVERHLSNIAAEAPVLNGSEIKKIPDLIKEDTKTTVNLEKMNGMCLISGEVKSENIIDESLIYIKITSSDGKLSKTYEAFPVSTSESDYGYQLYLNKKSMLSGNITVEVIVKNDDKAFVVKKERVFWDNSILTGGRKKQNKNTEIKIDSVNNTEFKSIGQKTSDSHSIFIYNLTGKCINQLNIRKSGDEQWNENILESDQKINNKEKICLFASIDDSKLIDYEIKIRFSDNQTMILSSIKLYDTNSLTILTTDDFVYCKFVSISGQAIKSTKDIEQKIFKQKLEQKEKEEIIKKAELEKQKENEERLQNMNQQQTDDSMDYDNNYYTEYNNQTQQDNDYNYGTNTVEQNTDIDNQNNNIQNEGDSNQHQIGCLDALF